MDATRPVAKALLVDNHPPDAPPIATPVGVPVTPAAAAVRAAYAPRYEPLGAYFFGRFAAFVLDVFAVAFVIATFLFNWIFIQLAAHTGSPLVALGISVAFLHQALHGSFVLMSALAFGCTFAFIWICETLFGTTLGKLLFGLAIRRSTGGRAGPSRVFTRNLLRPIDALVIGGLLALVTPKHQRIGDLAGGTIVVRSPLGPVATVLAAFGFIALAYAQVAFGGGIGSAAAVVAQTVMAVPRITGRITGTATPAPVTSTAPATRTSTTTTV